jgi:hypothetical protein
MKIIANLNSSKISVTKPFNILSLESIPNSRILQSSGTISYINIQDRVFTSYPAATAVNDYQIYPITIGTKPSGNLSNIWNSSNVSVATINSNGYVTHVSNGTSTITLNVQDKSASKTLNFSTSDVNNIIFTNYQNSSLAKHIVDTISSRVTNKVASTSKNIFSTQNHSESIYVRNENCWAYGLDLTCISPWNSLAAHQRAGTLISPRHMVFAAHYPITVGTTIRFVDLSNTVVTRTITGISTVLNTDIQIAILNSDVPNSISFARILPPNWFSYLPSLYSNSMNVFQRDLSFGLPALCLDQEEKALLNDLIGMSSGMSSASFGIPNNSKNAEFYETIISGDSGNPSFLIINNTLVLISTWFFPTSGPFVTFYKDQINSVMSTLGGNYQLTEINLSSFLTY